MQRVCAYCSDGYRFVSDVLYTNRHQLYGTAGSWFILDIVFYANGLFSGQVTASMGFGKTPKQESIAALILNVSSWAAASTFSIIITVRPVLMPSLSLSSQQQLVSLPGYICTILMVDRISLKELQLMSFFMTAFFFALLAILQPYLIQVRRNTMLCFVKSHLSTHPLLTLATWSGARALRDGVRVHVLLPELRSQPHHLHHPQRGLQHCPQSDVSRCVCRCGKARRIDWCSGKASRHHV